MNKLKKYLKDDKLDDIIIFGSFVKGKSKVNDVDICLVFKEYDDQLIEKILKGLEKDNIEVHITKTKYSDIFEDPGLWSTLIHEGFSIKKNKELSKILSFNPFFGFEYELTSLDKIQKQSFSHALFGTGGRLNFLEGIDGLRLGKNFIIVPVYQSEKIRDFFDTWKIIYKVRRVWL